MSGPKRALSLRDERSRGAILENGGEAVPSDRRGKPEVEFSGRIFPTRFRPNRKMCSGKRHEFNGMKPLQAREGSREVKPDSGEVSNFIFAILS